MSVNTGHESMIHYFPVPGKSNTEISLQTAALRMSKGGIRRVLVASTSGKTGFQAMSKLNDFEVIVVSHSQGFRSPNQQELSDTYRQKIITAGGKILTATHAFGGVGRAVRKRFGSVQVDEIMAQTLRIMGEGTKVGVEMAIMAADAGLVDSGENILTIAGTDKGADTVLVIRAANAQLLFDLRIQEIICKPLFE